MGEAESGAAARAISTPLRDLIRDAQVSCSSTAIILEVALMDQAEAVEQLERLKQTAAISSEALEALLRAIAEHLPRDA